MDSGPKCWLRTRPTARCVTWARGTLPGSGPHPRVNARVITRTAQTPLESILRGHRRAGHAQAHRQPLLVTASRSPPWRVPHPQWQTRPCNHDPVGCVCQSSYCGFQRESGRLVVCHRPRSGGQPRRHSERDSAHSWVKHKGNSTQGHD